jgi:hypothetical protein
MCVYICIYIYIYYIHINSVEVIVVIINLTLLCKLNITLVLLSQYNCDRFNDAINTDILLLQCLICQLNKAPVI